MQSYPNIDKSAFRKGEYVGYANGVWRIRRYRQGWRAVKAASDDAPTIVASTLAAMSKALESRN